MPIIIIDGKTSVLPQWREVSEKEWAEARWTKWTNMYEVCDRLSGKTIVCGHMPTFYADRFDDTRDEMDASIFYGEGVIAIDAGTFTSRQVNVLVLEE